MNAKHQVCGAMLLGAIVASSYAQTTVYDNLSTSATAGYSEPNSNNPIFGDSLNMTQGGTLGVFGFSIFNSTLGGNSGSILTGTMLLTFYDNTIPYAGGTLSATVLGSVSVNLDFTGAGGLPAGYYTTATVDLSSLNISVPQNILVTQQFSETSGTSTRNGVVLFSNPVIGTSPNTVYLKSSATTEGLYTFTGNAGQFGYSVQVMTAGNQPPVAHSEVVSVLENTASSITLIANDTDGDPLTYNLTATPTNGTLTGTAPNLTYTPAHNFLGTDSFSFTANDGFTDSVPAQVSITVRASAGLVIIPNFDTTITSDPNVAIIENTINSAIQVYESKYADPVTVNITFMEMNTGLGQSSTYFGTIDYPSFYSALTADAKSPNDTLALAHTPGGPNNPVDGTSTIALTTANFRALGFNANPPTGQPDSTIGLNMSLLNLDRLTIDPNKYDLLAVASHEIDEALGTGSGLGQANIRPVDLFRYSSGGSRSYTTAGDDAYFSINGGTTDLARYNQDSGGDYGDWWSTGPHTPQVQDAFGTPGATPDLGVELTVLDVIGYDLVTAPPPPVFESITHSGSTILLTWSAVSGRSYQLQYTPVIAPATWNNLGSPITATGPTASASDTIAAPQRYYRVAALPGPVTVTTPLPAPKVSLTPVVTYLRPAAQSALSSRGMGLSPEQGLKALPGRPTVVAVRR